MSQDWKQAQKWEKDWHGNCVNSFYEEEKQLVYAEKIGLVRTPDEKTPYRFDLKGTSVLDIGGGAYSLLLKCVNFTKAVVVDPLGHPEWVVSRYFSAGIKLWTEKGEDLKTTEKFDEVWIYNVLQHTESPGKIIANAKKVTKLIRIFEWIETGTNIGHIHSLTEKQLNLWLGGEGKIERMGKPFRGNGLAYYGIFPV